MRHWVKSGARFVWRAANEAARLRGRRKIRGLLEQPIRRQVYSHWVDIRGWAISTDGDPLYVEVHVNGKTVHEIAVSEERLDVGAKDERLSKLSPFCGFDAIVSLEDHRLPRYSLLTAVAVSRRRPTVRRALGLTLLERRRAGDREVPRHAYQETWDAVSGNLTDARYSVAGTADEKDLAQSGESTATDIQRETVLSQSDRVLEIGCGVGRVGVNLAPRCQEWVGADVSENMLRHAQHALTKQRNVSFVHLNGIDLSGIADNSFDVVYCTAVFMHLDEWDRFRYVCEAHRVLKPGGRVYYDNFCLTSPDGWDLFEQMSKLDPAARPPNISKSSTAEELRAYSIRAGFGDVRIRVGTLFVTVIAQKAAGVADDQPATEMASV
jgi:ubiquinone/menaquinone biosynthesis C-methylase UbiE